MNDARSENLASRLVRAWPGLPLFMLLGVLPGMLCLNAPLLLGYDDKYITTENPMITRGLGFFFEQLMLPFRHQERVGFVTPHWAPISYFSVALDYAIFGMSPLAFRVISGLYHGACGWFVLRVATKLLDFERGKGAAPGVRAEWKALIVALIFLLHPTVCESVCWIIERNNILPVLFGIWALDVYTGTLASGGRDEPSWPRVAAAFALLLLSQLCKASGVCWWPIMGAWDFFLMRRGDSDTTAPAHFWLRRLARWAVLGLPIALSIYAIRLSHADVLMEPIGTKPFGPWLMWIYLTIRYVGLMAWPLNLSAFYHVSPAGVPWGDPSLWLTVGGIAASIWGARALRVPWARIALCACWIVAAVAPIVNPFVTTSFLIQDRYVYPAMPAFACIVVELLTEMLARLKVAPVRALACAALVPAVLLPLTLARSTVWRSVEELFGNAIQAQPDCSFGYCFLANDFSVMTPPNATPLQTTELLKREAALYERARLCDDYDRQQWPLHYTAEHAVIALRLGQPFRAQALAESVWNGRAERESEHGAKLDALRMLIALSMQRSDRALTLSLVEAGLDLAPNDGELLSARIRLFKDLGRTAAYTQEVKRVRALNLADPGLIDWLKTLPPD